MTKKTVAIVNLDTDEIEREFDVTGQSERQIERLTCGLLINLDTKRFYVAEKTVSTPADL